LATALLKIVIRHLSENLCPHPLTIATIEKGWNCHKNLTLRLATNEQAFQ
jgi:hypothetical protein